MNYEQFLYEQIIGHNLNIVRQSRLNYYFVEDTLKIVIQLIFLEHMCSCAVILSIGQWICA